MSGRPRPASGLVTLAALDVRRRPDHASEMGTQLLMGESVRVIRSSADDRWLLVENAADRYRGWVRSWGVSRVGSRRIAGWRRRARARVTALWLEVREAPGRGRLVTPVFRGSRLIAGRSRRGFRPVELPDGARGWVNGRGLVPVSAPPPPLARRAREMLGVPYLWGGRTPAGLDCSGLVQMLLAEEGIAMPRDARDQERVSRRIGPGHRPRPGDLVFFGPSGSPAGHVGIFIDEGTYVHCSGRVRLNSIHSDNPLYDNGLVAQFRGFRRPPDPTPARPAPARRRGRYSS